MLFLVVLFLTRNVYDKLQSEELSPKGAERRTDIELLALKAAQKRNHVVVRWVHSEAQLGNALTKAGAKELDLFYTMKGMWRIVEDDGMRSARKRRSTNTPLFELPWFLMGKLFVVPMLLLNTTQKSEGSMQLSCPFN